MTNPIRRECADMLKLGGVRVDSTSNPYVVFFHIGRWLVRKDVLVKFVLSPLCRVVDLVRLKLRRVDTDRDVELILMRDVGRLKVSIFSLCREERDVFLHYGFDFEREIEAIEDFSDKEFGIPRISDVNHRNRSYKQKLVCDFLSRESRVTGAGLERMLRSFLLESDLEYMPTTAYIDRVCQSVDYLAENGLYRFPEKLYGRRDEIGESLDEVFIKGVPMCRAHGDFSVGNILKGDDGLLYLNDFDRSFLASFVFDLMYVAVTEGWPAHRIAKSFQTVIRRRDMKIVTAGVGLLDLCNSMFIMDLCRFIEDRHRSISHAEDRECKFSVSMIERVI